MLEIESLCVAYGDHPVLNDIDLQVGEGEVVALIGPNGAGKTTLMRAISGVIRLQAGTIRIAGENLAQLSGTERARYLSVVPQARNLPETFSVHQAVLLGRTPYIGWLGQTGQQDLKRVDWALERTHLLPLAGRLVGQLSGGEQQRVLLARALAQDTPVMLLDEPTSHLDLQHQSVLLNLVRELARERGLCVLMALHDLNMAALYAHRVALLVDGCFRAVGSPVEVLTPMNLKAAYHVPVQVISHPHYGTPLVLPDGRALNP